MSQAPLKLKENSHPWTKFGKSFIRKIYLILHRKSQDPERGYKLLVARDYWCSKANADSIKICEKCTYNPKYKICCLKHNSWTILWLCFAIHMQEVMKSNPKKVDPLAVHAFVSFRLSHMPLQPSTALQGSVLVFPRMCLIEHLSQIWALWCNILTLSAVRPTRVWNRIIWFWLVSFYLAKCLLTLCCTYLLVFCAFYSGSLILGGIYRKKLSRVDISAIF